MRGACTPGAGTLDLVTRNWTRVRSFDGLFCSGHTLDSEGRVVVVGGHKQVHGAWLGH